ncbi:MAG: GNAT family N-acetyltransferase [Pseudomonadota bacterium]
MHIEVIESSARFVEVETDWDELFAIDPCSHIYLSSRYIRAIVARAVGKFRILTAWTDDQRLVGVFPLFPRTKWDTKEKYLYTELDMLGRGFDADYTGFLADPAHQDAVSRAFAEAITKMAFGRLVLRYFNSTPQRLEMFCSVFNDREYDIETRERKINGGETNNLICPYVDLPDTLPDYLKGLSSNARQKFRRLLRQLQNDPELRVTRSSPETFQRDAEILSDLWYHQHSEQKGAQRAKNIKDQFREIVKIGLVNGLIYLPVLWRGRNAVAAQANYIDPVRRHSLFYVGGRDKSQRDISVGLMLHAHSIRWSIANGLTRYDFTRGDEPYKYNFGAIDNEIIYLEVARKPCEGAGRLLDANYREDAVAIIRQKVSSGKGEEARRAAHQAFAVWPDLADTIPEVAETIPEVAETINVDKLNNT